MSNALPIEEANQPQKVEEVKSLLALLEQEQIEPSREFGETITCSAKDDHGITKARVVPNMSDTASDTDKWIYVSQGKLHNIVGISITLKSLKEIVQWAESKAK
jgi:hypothetical protein